jgi:hypothetical protein
MTGHQVPSFFHTKKNGAATGVFGRALEISLAVSMVSHHFTQSSRSVMILDTCLEHKHKVNYLMVTGGDMNLC